MKIAYIGNFEPEYSTENDVRKAFEHLNHEVITLQENKILTTMLEKYCLESDLVLITSTWDHAIDLKFWLTLMKKCADKNIPTATLHLDTFWSTIREGRQWWLNPMFHTAYIFTADGDYQDKWKKLGKNHIWLPPAVRHDATNFGTFREEYACDVAFVGSNGRGYHQDVWFYRTELVDYLREMCERNNWSFKNPGGDDEKISRGQDLNDFYASTIVTVGDSLCLNKEDSKYWSDRVPEATGRGALLIMPKIKELEKIYDRYLPMYQWHDFEDLEKNVKLYLNMKDKVRKNIIKQSQSITAREHTYVNRAETILQEVGL